MNRTLVGITLLFGAALAATARPTSAQLAAAVHVSWEWGDEGWRAGPVVDGYVVWGEAPEPRRKHRAARVRGSRARFHVPPGHLPPPGMCRLWVVGMPPGQQAAPTDCRRAFRARPRPGTVVLHTPLEGERARWREHRWKR